MRGASIILALLVGACAAPAAAPSSSSIPTPTESPSPTASATPTPPSPTPSLSPTATSAVFTNYVMGYRIDLPPPWRRSACLSTEERAQLPPADGFVQVAEKDEVGTDVGYTFAVVRVSVEPNPDRLTPERWVASGKLGSTQGQTAEPATLDGRAALLVRPTAFGPLAYVMGAGDRMFVIGYQTPANDSSNEAAMRRMVQSFHLLTDQERAAAPSPAPVVARSAETVADTLAEGFTQLNADLLGTVMTPCMAAALEQAGGTFTPRTVLVQQLRDAFAAGLRVAVERRPVASDATGAFVKATWTQPGVAVQRRDLYLRSVGAEWSWYLTLTRQPVR
jgi:hypothetical protein